MSRALIPLLLAATTLQAQTTGRSADWPVYGGSEDHTHYTTLGQISPANVKQLKVAWTYDTKDSFTGSEMQANPIVIDGVMYATTPKLHVIALNAATGVPIWRFDPNNGAPPASRFRHRGVVVTGDRVIFNYRNRLYALNRKTGRPITTFGDSGWVDLRQGLGRPVEGLSVSASTPVNWCSTPSGTGTASSRVVIPSTNCVVITAPKANTARRTA